MKERKLFQKKDLIFISILLFTAFIVSIAYNYVNRDGDQLLCHISYDGKLLQSVDLSEDKIFAFEKNPHVVFEIKDHAIAFSESDCPDKICIHSGFLSSPGQMAACLPNLVSIRIVSENGFDDIDMIAN